MSFSLADCLFTQKNKSVKAPIFRQIEQNWFQLAY
jgi:hypothetical protein